MISAERWTEMRRIYHAALERPTTEWAAFLETACGEDTALRDEVASLLAYETGTGPLDQPAMETAAKQLAGSLDALEPESLIGPYKILEPVGRGGMGIVYRAEQQEPVRRMVALKIIKPGMDSQSVMARFQAERQTLAMMEHPNIARVLDAGTTATGRLYFVMELVEGLAATEYCTKHALDLRQRLELFIPICHAIQHAHQKGIIHRDIKPSNVLVTNYDGKAVPKVIDFGIAKAMSPDGMAEQQTLAGAAIGTPDYMSPEQAGLFGSQGDVDTRSDIYALGALLYELVTGETPLRLAKVDGLEVLRRIREEEPKAPSARLGEAKLARQVRGELDWVVMRALEKDRTRRYASVGALVEDVDNFLQGDPVQAGPPSAMYRLRKLARRYRAPLATAAAFLVLLVGAAVYSAQEAIRARRAERSAEAVSAFLQEDLLAQASASVQSFAGGRPDPDLKVRTALDRAAAGIAAKFAGQPLLEAAIRHTIGSSYLDLGLYAQAAPQLTRAASIRREMLGERDPATLATESLLVNVSIGLGKPRDAMPKAERILALRRQTLGERHPETVTALEHVASVHRANNRNAQANATLQEVVDARMVLLGAKHLDTLRAQMNLGLTFMYLDKFKEAAAILQQVFDSRRSLLGDQHASTMESRNALGLARMNIGEPEQGEVLLQEVYAWRRKVLGPAHRDTLGTLNGLALTLEAQGKYKESEALFSQCIAVASEALGAHHPSTEACRRNRGMTLGFAGEYGEAVREYRAIVERDLQTAGPESPDTLRDSSNLAILLDGAGRHAEGHEMLLRVIAVRRKVLGPKDPKTLSSLNSFGLMEQRAGKFAEAQAVFAEVLPLRREVLGATNIRTLDTATSLAYVLLEQGQAQPAEALLREAIAGAGNAEWELAVRKGLLGWSLAQQKRLAEAEPLLRSAYQELVQLQGRQPAEQRREVERAQRRLAQFGQGR